MTTKSNRRKKPTPKEVEIQYRYCENSNDGLIPLMLALVALLPKDWQPYGERIVAIMTVSLIAMFALYIIGLIATSLSGHSDWMPYFIATDVLGVAILASASIMATVRQKT